MPAHMRLRILLPYRIFGDFTNVSRVVLETTAGSLGMLPRRLDCVAALTPGILTYQLAGEKEKFIAVDEGVLVKAGADVRVSVRDAIGGVDLGRLRDAVRDRYARLDDAEKSARAIVAKLESDFIRRFIELKHER